MPEVGWREPVEAVAAVIHHLAGLAPPALSGIKKPRTVSTSQGPAGIRALTALRQYAHTPLQPYVVANQSRGPACDAQSDAGCRGIHDEIAEPCMTPRNPPLGKFDRTTGYH